MARLSITFRDGTPPAEVKLGSFSQIAAIRRFGLDRVKTDDPEVAMFGAFVELVGPAAAKRPPVLVVGEEVEDPFDVWLMNVDEFGIVNEEEEDPEDPTSAETPSESWADSPPTSE